MDSSNLLKSWRESRHISQEEFGSMIGVRGPMVSHLESRRYLPSLPVFERIYRVTRIPLRSLLEFFLNADHVRHAYKRDRRKNKAAR